MYFSNTPAMDVHALPAELISGGKVLWELTHYCLCLACRQQRGADNEAIRAEQALQLAAENQAAEAARLRDYRNELRHRMDIEVSLLGAPYIYPV